MRASTSSLAIPNSWVFTQATPTLPRHGILMYRMRINASKGYETKVTVFGEYILRITNNGQHLEWDLWGHQFEKQGDSSIVVGNSAWTTVMFVYSETSVTLLENGVAKFTDRWDPPPRLTAQFHVQHLDTGTAVSVDLSHVRYLT